MAEFNIFLNGNYLATKRAWNSSIRFIEAHVKSVAKEGEVFNLTESKSIRCEKTKKHYEGLREWKSNDTTLFYVIIGHKDTKI